MSPSARRGAPSRQRSSQSQPTTSRARMPSLFITIRNSIYGTVLLFTLICLAMAGHFQSVLAASDLTRFVPFAIFVCSASMFIFLVLISFAFFLRERNPISTKVELACLGLAGMFWLVLGVFLITSDAQSADVECFASDASSTPLDDASAEFHTDQYQAMYRVLMSFSLMNAALVLFACFALLFLALRRHRKGDEHMWHGPVTSCAWFNNYENAKQTRGKVSSSSILPVASAYMGGAVFTEKPQRQASARRERDRDHSTRPSRNQSSRNPYPTPPKDSPSRNYPRQGSGNSPRSARAHGVDLEKGGMLNPYSGR
ncbi:hypothetical protein GALMADRAFT_236076 [Galerina marginata CBS 339.88]|uniref:MARVEL domain-containing protein n=1 Tax=Galerina marginata (strain CBS 339.88) TaxID=685588 RepID=A0A067TUW4_GALM3|nr:hypothetical protein GALMADRAFT_236076 [Galerina marginata CBS 339.88]